MLPTTLNAPLADAVSPSSRHTGCIHERFEDRVREAPHSVAIIDGSGELTYFELNRRANRLAHHLRDRGIGPDDIVALCMERGPDAVVGILAILKSGGTYLPLDASYPLDRLRYMARDARPRLAVAKSRFAGFLSEAVDDVVDIESLHESLRDMPSDNLPPGVCGATSQTLAYVIYTSGSTGQPKGVMIEHGSLLNYLQWRHSFYHTTSADVFLQKAPLSFDMSVAEILVPLTIGATLVPVPLGSEKDPVELADLVRRHGVTQLSLLPSVLKLLLPYWPTHCDSVRHVFCGGEVVGGDVATSFYGVVGTHCCLHNVYGPTETTLVVSQFCCPRSHVAAQVPIGKPIDNVTFHVLSDTLDSVEVGDPGELYVGGQCLARGYLNSHAAASSAFTNRVTRSGVHERLYRTGDFVRQLHDGNFEFLGRIDHQVKIRGYRIELGEVESAIAKHAGVREAVVVTSDDVFGGKRLVAYYTGERHKAEVLRRQLQLKLPEYMVPAAFVHLDVLPLSPNGKLDRNGLPAPGIEAFNHREYEEPVGNLETLLAQIWREVLRVEIVGRGDNFFELGGNSLLALHATGKLNRCLHEKIPILMLFQLPVLRDLCEYISAKDLQT